MLAASCFVVLLLYSMVPMLLMLLMLLMLMMLLHTSIFSPSLQVVLYSPIYLLSTSPNFLSLIIIRLLFILFQVFILHYIHVSSLDPPDY